MHKAQLFALLLGLSLVFTACQKNEKSAEPDKPNPEEREDSTPTEEKDPVGKEDPNPTSGQPTVEQGDPQPAADLEDPLFDKIAPLLPANTSALVLLRLDRDPVEAILGAEWLEWLMGKDRKDQLYQDLSKLFDARVGLDPLKVRWLAIAASEDGWFGVLFGGPEIINPNLQGEDLEGGRQVTLSAGIALVEFTQAKAYLFSSEPYTEFKAKHPKDLRSSPQFGAIKGAFSANFRISSVALMHKPPLNQFLAMAPEPALAEIEVLSLSIDKAKKLSIKATGEKEALEKVMQLYEGYKEAQLAELRALKENMDSLPFEMKLAVIAGSHMSDSQYYPSLNIIDDALVLELQLDGPVVFAGLIGMGAAVAVPAFLKYMEDAKKSEAYENLKWLGDGAITYFQEEHAAPDGLSVTTREFPIAEQAICTTPFSPNGDKVTGMGDVTSEAFFSKSLRFEIRYPHYFQYCYQSDGKSFEASATAALHGQGVADTKILLNGSIDPSTGGPIIEKITEVAP